MPYAQCLKDTEVRKYYFILVSLEKSIYNVRIKNTERNQRAMTTLYNSGLREECGVFGIYDLDGNDVAPLFIMALKLNSTGARSPAASPFPILRGRKAECTPAKVLAWSMRFLRNQSCRS